jgi:hypothetical protein
MTLYVVLREAWLLRKEESANKGFGGATDTWGRCSDAGRRPRPQFPGQLGARIRSRVDDTMDLNNKSRRG